MNCDEAVKYIHSLERFGIKPGLERIAFICSKLGNPQNRLKFIHIAGTNGKGSVCSFIDSILRSAGYTTALFTSPHLITLRERFVENGQMVSEERVVDAFVRVDDLMKKGMEEGLMPMTYFEVLFLF